jgi:serine/threonine protein kinase/Flp pilus assembly protein TadD
MTPELWQRLKPLFYAALDRPIEERMAYIDEVCGTDGELKTHLVQLIQAAQEETATADRPLVRLFQPRPMRFSSGEIILERFRIVRPIGSGGMGEVYEAEDMQLGRVALKTIRDQIASSPGVFSRFRQEVQLARKVSGAQVCRIHELHLLPAAGGHGATAFLTMEYLEGVTLAEKLKRDGPFPLKEALRIALDICEGLKLVHGNGVIHRDLKCANIMLCGEGDSLRAVLMDFGLARDFSASDSSGDGTTDSDGGAGTVAGAIMGTPAYMAPEQFESKPVSTATDIYALGIVLYELVTGIHPYAAPTPVAAAIRRAHIPARPSKIIRSVPRKWDRVINRCLEYEAADRYQGAEEVARALRAGPSDVVNLRQDRPTIFWLAAALLLGAIAWGTSAFWQQMQYYRPGRDAQRLYDEGVASLHEGTNVKATHLLQKSIEKDPQFVMAHVRLAEALYKQDFVEDAQQELLIAHPEHRRLSSLDGFYLDAIQATVIGDSDDAIRNYAKIKDEAPVADESAAFMELGMAYERAGAVNHALECYRQATMKDGNNPAAYMHSGVLESLLHHVEKADHAFDQAQTIYSEEINTEGLAELNYARGYAVSDRGDPKGAVHFLEESLEDARKIQSIQLEIKALIQLSVAEYSANEDSLAIEHADEATQLARDNKLESWAADGLLRQANAKLDQGDWKGADKPYQQAMSWLKHNPQPRVYALAKLTLATQMDEAHRPAEVIAPAQEALSFYNSHGYFSNASTASLLLIRAERNQRHYKQAFAAGNDFLTLATQSGIPYLTTQAEEVVGTIYLALEDYPNAWSHFERARLAADTESRRSYQANHCGDVLWRLGHYTEADAMFKLASTSGDSSLLAGIDESQVESLLSQRSYKAALQSAQKAILKYPDMVADRKRDFEQDETVAESYLGMRKQALAGLSAFVAPNQKKDDPADSAQDKLTAAEVYLALGMNQEAHDEAVEAHDYFASIGQPDSELRSACLAAAASKALKDDASYRMLSKKSLDILSRIQQTWGPAAFQSYSSRPDMHFLALRAAKKPE